MSIPTIILVVIIAFIICDFVLERVLYGLNARDFGKPIPPELSGIYDDEKYRRQQDYSKAKYKVGVVSSVVSVVISVAAFALGLFGWLDGVLREWVTGWSDNIVFQTIALCILFFIVISVVNTLLDIPISYYSMFTIEERFGFNKSTKKLFWIDQIKSLILSLIIMIVILSLVTWIYAEEPRWFWIMAWGVLTIFQIFMMTFYSNLIVPLFNKQTPLEEGELRSKIEEFASKVDFKLDNIYVMDSSKRSTHANAYFTGLGSHKRIVLYDTLISQLTPDEIVAVLAHEIGHYKHKHTLRQLLMAMASNLLMFFILGLAISSQELSEAMGGTTPAFHLGVLAMGILYTPISTAIGIFSNVLSRRYEYQADAFAGAHGMADNLISALKKLSSASLSNLQPHPALVFVHFSHPTLLQRIKRLKA